MTEYSDFPDEQLIAACRTGDEKAWNTLVERYERLVYTIPARYGLTSSEIDDVFQSTWLSLLKNMDKLREPDRVSAWLVTTARRECWERRRGADYERTVTSDLDTLLTDRAGEELPPEDVVVTFRQYETLRGAMAALGDRCRKLLWMLYYDSDVPSYSDVAEQLEMPIGSIGPMRARCLKKLRGILTNVTGGE
jgi:RNA polymerase sigma factor (sigma-70 family)